MPGQVDEGDVALVVRVGEVKGEPARRLEPLDARFTEGFDAADLVEAKALIETLRA
jgi:hypothetical protein